MSVGRVAVARCVDESCKGLLRHSDTLGERGGDGELNLASGALAAWLVGPNAT